MHERRELQEKADGFPLERTMLRCRLLLAQPRRRAAALPLLEELARTPALKRPLALFLAHGFLLVKDDARALEFVRRARRADPESWEALSLETRIHQAAGRHNDAVNAAVESLSLVYFQPNLHYLLGLSLRRLGENERAANEFRVALSMAPGMAAAHDQLAVILRRDRTRLGEAGLHMAQAAEIRKRSKPQEAAAANTANISAAGHVFERAPADAPADRSRVITVVTGLPRSGTSMLMQALAGGGLSPYTDERRAPDEDNPRGYLEHEEAAGLHRDASWIPRARGKAVKIVAHLLPHLPPGEEYRVVFLHRNLEK